jgi:SSS family solute:Na+ symporter
LTELLALFVGGFCAVMFAVAVWAGRRVETTEDFVVAGRRLSLPLTTASLVATWFGAGTVLVAADAIAEEGLRVTALEPIGSGLCLFLAGMFFARRLWNEKLLTLNQYFGRMFGRRAEVLVAAYDLSFITWVATQFLALAAIFELFFGLPIWAGVALSAAFLTAYTTIGGMWSVAVTDLFQLVCLTVGLVVLTWTLVGDLGQGSPLAGVNAILAANPAERLILVPTENGREFLGWLGLLVAASLGNLPGQDLMQRIFSARSADTAVRASYASGVLYIALGCLPVLLGLSATLVLGNGAHETVIAALAERLLSPAATAAFLLVVMAAVTSSVDSGLLAPATVLATSVIPQRIRERFPSVALVRICVVLCGLSSVGMALSGLSAFELLEGSYSAHLTPFVVLALGTFRTNDPSAAGFWTLALGLIFWLGEIALAIAFPDFDLDASLPVPSALISLVLSAAVYLAICAIARFSRLTRR